jgi:ubiquinone/menaquinone biosynthesis C-methylase UbiE
MSARSAAAADPARYHAMLPGPLHDERARQDFVGTLRSHLASRVVPGHRVVYEKRVAPALQARLGRAPADRFEVRELMDRDPYYRFWSAMQRRSQEMMWESVIDPVERCSPELVGSYRRLAGRRRRRGSLRLDPMLVVPRYHTAVDIHLQPGGYHTDFAADDVAAGAIYDRGLQIYSAGSTGPWNEAMGLLLVDYLRERDPGFEPARILDLGCAIGNSTLPWALAFPRARVEAIDVAAPQLRFGHARAEALGVELHFSQQNAEQTYFADGSFDLVVSHIVLHETSRSALRNILRECRRLLRPGGWMLHLEIPRGKTPLEQFLMNWESWNNNETFGSLITDIDLAAEAVAAGFDTAQTRCVDYARPRPAEQRLYSDYVLWRVLESRR